MAGLLEYLIASLGDRAQRIPGVTMPAPDDLMLDPVAEAEAARVAAAAKLGRRRAGMPGGAPDPQAPAPPFDGDPAALAEAARVAAAGRLGVRRGPMPDAAPVAAVDSSSLPSQAPMGSVLGSMGMPGMLSGKGFRSAYDEADPAGVAQAARDAAAVRTKNGVVRRGAFDGGATAAVPFAGMLSSSGLLGAPGAGAGTVAAADPASAPTPPPDLPPSTNDPQAKEPVVFEDGVPLPRPRPDSGLNGQPGAGNGPAVNTPPAPTPAPMSLAPPVPAPTQEMSARPAMPGAPLPIAPAGAPAVAAPVPEAGAPFMDGLKGLLGKIIDPDKASTYMALGSGFSGAPSFGTGMSRASAAAVPAMAADRANAIKQGGIGASYRALVSRGVPPAEALAAVYNPDIMKATAAKYFETKPLVPHKIGTDMMGNDIMGSFNPNTGKYYDAANREIKAEGDAGGAAGVGTGGAGILAKGVKEYDSSLPAEDYKAQFSPEVQAQMDAYIRGDTQPTGNPRMKGLATKIKEWAVTYGSKAGIPVSDALFSERRKYRTELGSNSAATAGGQSKAFVQGIDHMTSLAQKFEKLDNWNGLGVPWLADKANAIRQGMSTKQAGLAAEAAGIGQTLAGEVGKLFSGSAGGGVHERQATMDRFKTVKSGPELAGALEATLETMRGGLTALEGRRDQILGPGSGVEFVPKETREKMDRIQMAIDRLRAGESAPAASMLAPGQSRAIDGVTIRRIN